MKTLIAALVAAALLTGCAREPGNDPHTAMQSWKGQNVDDVILAWGPPARTAELSNGTRVMEWEKQQRVYIPNNPVSYNTITATNGATTSHTQTTSNPGGSVAAWTCYRRFEVNRDNIVTGYSFEGC